MSSAAAAITPGPLLSEFTPPPGCFEQPMTWTRCYRDFDVGNGPFSCFWWELASCWPSSAYTTLEYFGTWGSILNYQYSPAGIFPSGFSAVDVNRHFTATTAAGCLSGWTNVGGAYCSKQVDAVWQAQGAETNGPFSAIMPQISITWAPSDLSWISPMTAPASMVREFYAARETSRNASSHSTATRVPKMTENSSLSTGVKAGIGVGVAVAVLLLCLIGLGSCLLLKRRKQDPSPPESPKPQDERQPYLDRKPELATYEVKEISNDGLSQRSNEERTELETNEVYELDTGWLPYEAAAIKQSEKPTAKESPPLSPISLHSDAQSVRSSLSLEGQDEGMAPKS